MYTFPKSRQICPLSTAMTLFTTTCRAIERYGASLKEDEGDEESMVGLAKTHLKRSASSRNWANGTPQNDVDIGMMRPYVPRRTSRTRSTAA